MSEMSTKPKYTGVDYCRYTHPDDSLFERWDAALAFERVREENAGRKSRMGWVMQYYGDKGEHYFLGKSEQGCMVQASGALAWSNWRTLGKGAHHCTRLDLQVTWPIDGSPGQYIRDMYECGQASPKREGRTAGLTLTDTPQGAKMLTVGSRQSLLYGRMYDKGRESGLPEYDGWVRWEIEVKGEQANDLDQYLRLDEMEIPHTRSIVSNFWTQRGMSPFWDTYEAMFIEPPMKRAKTDDTKIAWIATQVAPAAQILRSHGKLDQALRAFLSKSLTEDQINRIIDAVYEEEDS